MTLLLSGSSLRSSLGLGVLQFRLLLLTVLLLGLALGSHALPKHSGWGACSTLSCNLDECHRSFEEDNHRGLVHKEVANLVDREELSVRGEKEPCPPEATVLDNCNCCSVCLRGLGGICGGRDGSKGICEDDLTCVVSFSGLEVEGRNKGKEEQTNITSVGLDSTGFCQNLSHYQCSIKGADLTDGEIANESDEDRHPREYFGCLLLAQRGCLCFNVTSCEKPSYTFASREDCEKVKAKNQMESKCANVTCPVKEPCPDDSYWTSGESDDCCPDIQKCECLPTACKDVNCPKELHPKVVSRGNGKPGTCCTEFKCVQETEVSCQFENRIYKSGSEWKTDKCTACSCQKGMTFCHAITCDPSMICGYMFYPEGECCPICSGCVSPAGRFYNNSMMWKEDDCTTCQCIEGKMNCQSETCQSTCSHPLTSPGQCCPICNDKPTKIFPVVPYMSRDTCRVERNKEYGPDEMWYDGCRQCYCLNGREMCAVLTCPVLHCDRPKTIPHHCCPVCTTGDHHSMQSYSSTICQAIDGRYHVEGESWSLDPCTWCICIKGQVLCEATQCPPTPCLHPIRHVGSCCMTCAEKPVLSVASAFCYAEDGMTVYAEGQHWRSSPCRSCICLHGKPQCYQETCPPVDCSHPLMVKHRCCPVCLGQKNSQTLVCLQNGLTYRDGERWSVNACTSCVCVKGMQMCTEKVCPAWCSRPVHVPGQCCPLCEEGSDFGSGSGGHPSQLSLAIVVICATIMVLLVLVIIFLVMANLRQGKSSHRNQGPSSCQGALLLGNVGGVGQGGGGGSGGGGLCRGQRPKSTNLELQGMSHCTKPLLDNSNELRKLQDQGSPVMKNIV